MKFALILALAGFLVAGCQSAPVEREWKPSTLSEQTIAKAQAATVEYQKCLDAETKKWLKKQGDPRAITNAILQQCENKLLPIKTAFDAENVPASISERYMRRNRSQGAQAVLRFVEAVYAMRSAEQAATPEP